jgi:nucleoside-diphosphate-sugar epimerase
MGLRTLVSGGSGFIGTNLVERLLQAGREVLSIDVRPPGCEEYAALHRRIDILDRQALFDLLEDFRPHEVVHLAARTDFVDSEDVAGYTVNTTGTANVVEAIAQCGTVSRSIFASSNVVPGKATGAPAAGGRGSRFGYAESKIAAERIVGSSSLQCDWCIVRPCYVWGPWFSAPFRDFFLTIARGRYFHLGSVNPPKLLGYVGNVVFEILGLLDADRDRIHRQTLYLVDYEPTTIREWSEMICLRLGRRRPLTLPEPLVQLAARAGDLLKLAGSRNPPLTTTRLANMRTDTTGIPLDSTREIIGPLPYTLEQGVEETVRWLRQAGLLDTSA